MKNILLKLEEKEFFGLSKLKSRIEYLENKDLTWEEFIIFLKKSYDRN